MNERNHSFFRKFSEKIYYSESSRRELSSKNFFLKNFVLKFLSEILFRMSLKKSLIAYSE
jgi:hypothetical protein